MGKGGNQYDVSILRTDGEADVGLMLDEVNGKKRYERFTDPALAQQFFTGDVDYGRLEPEKELALTQSSWMSGFGQEFYDGTSPNHKRYYMSKGADGRFDGNVVCGPTATAIALTDYSATITDGGLETWTDVNTLTNWTKSAAGTWLTRVTTPLYAGTYSARTQPAQDRYFSQSPTWDTKYRGVRVTVTAMCRADDHTIETGFLSIYDGIGTTNGTSLAQSGTWTTMSVTRVISATATELTIRCNHDYISGAGGSPVYWDAIAWGAPVHGNPIAYANFNDLLYMAYGDCLVKLNGTGDGWTFVYNFDGKTITDLEPFVDDNLYICLGSTAAKYYYMSTAEAVTQSTLADGFAKYMCNVAGTMHKVVLANQIKKATDPTNAGSWGSAITVGSTFTDITSINAEQDVVYIHKEDMSYYLDSADADIPLTEELQSLASSTNGKNSIVWHRNVYIPMGSSLGEYASDGTFTWRSPTRFHTNLSDFVGSIQALAADEEYLFAILDNSTKNEILAGKLTTVDNTTFWAWHPIQQITLTGCETAHVSSVYKKRLWIASTSSSESVYYIPLPTQYGDIDSDTNYTFLTGGYLVTPWLHSNLRADSKGYHKLTLLTEGCDDNNYITVEYQTYFTALSGTWTTLGNFTTSPSQTKYFSNVTGTMIRFRFTVVTNTTASSPKLVNYDCRGTWRPTKRQLIAMTVKLGDYIPTKDGSEPSSGYQAVEDAINEAVNKLWPNTFYDIDASTKYVYVLYARKHELSLVKGQLKPEANYELFLEEVTLS